MLLRCSLLMVGCCCVSITVLSQPRLTFLTNAEFTTTGLYYKFNQHGHVLKRGIIDEYGTDDRVGVNYGVGLHFRATKRFAFEAGYARTSMDLEVHDQNFLDVNGLGRPKSSGDCKWAASDAQFDIAKHYNVAYFQVYYFTRPSSSFTPYFSVGIARNFLDSKQPSGSAYYTYDATGEHQTLTASFSPKYVSGLIEAGVLWGNGPNSGRWSYFSGIDLHIAGRMVTGEYSNIGGKQEYTDQASATGSYLSLSFRLGYTIGYIDHSERESTIHDHYHHLRPTSALKLEKSKAARHNKPRGPAFKGFKNKKSKAGDIERRIQRSDN